MTKVSCAPIGTLLPADTDLPFILYGARLNHAYGEVGRPILPIIRKMQLTPAIRAWDFLSIALAVVAADESCKRQISADGWTRQIELSVAVADQPFWTSQAVALSKALCFLTGDIWKLSFTDGGFLPEPQLSIIPRPEELVCLLSGGMDSLIGAINLQAEKREALLVSQVAKGDKADQKRFAQIIMPNGLHLQLNHKASPPGVSERSQRARSICFLGYGVLAATCLDRYTAGDMVDLLVPENGYISMNIPLTPLRVGSLSTRTTHPFYFASIQEVLNAAGLRVKLGNPYKYKTKGEMLEECQDQTLLEQLIGATTSCGRYARTGFTQCGRCVPCLVRRASFNRWGKPDLSKPYRYDNLATPGPRHRDFDDVRSVAMAAETVRTSGLDEWVGGSLNSVQIGDPIHYKAVVARGLNEMTQWLTQQGVI